jgi:hypothetical protein
MAAEMLGTLVDYLRLVKAYLQANLKAQLEYRGRNSGILLGVAALRIGKPAVDARLENQPFGGINSTKTRRHYCDAAEPGVREGYRSRPETGVNPAFTIVVAASGDARKRIRALAASGCRDALVSAPAKETSG